MASSNVRSLLTTDEILLDSRHETTRAALATVVPADVENADGFDFDEPGTIALLKRQNYKMHLGVRITSDFLRPTISLFDTRAEPSLVRTSNLLPEWRCRIMLLQMSLVSASDDRVAVTGKSCYFICPAGRC